MQLIPRAKTLQCSKGVDSLSWLPRISILRQSLKAEIHIAYTWFNWEEFPGTWASSLNTYQTCHMDNPCQRSKSRLMSQQKSIKEHSITIHGTPQNMTQSKL